MLHIINQIDKALGFIRTRVLAIDKEKFQYEIVADKKWVLASPLLSCLTLLLRISTSHNGIDTYQKFLNKVTNQEVNLDNIYDYRYVTHMMYFLPLFIKYGIKHFFHNTPRENWELKNISKTHSAGISGLYLSKQNNNNSSLILSEYPLRKKLYDAIARLEKIKENKAKLLLEVKSNGKIIKPTKKSITKIKTSLKKKKVQKIKPPIRKSPSY